MISDTVVHDLIRSWRLARLSSGVTLGWPKITLLGRMVELGGNIVASLRGQKSHVVHDLTVSDKDADLMQQVVEQMPDKMRAVFEAYHIGVIREKSCRGTRHKARAAILGISYETYNRRRVAGWCYVQDWAAEYFEK